MKYLIEINGKAYLTYNDTVIDKRYAKEIKTSKLQYIGKEHDLIQDIGWINCVYVTHKIGKRWVIYGRIYDPPRDGKTKIEHVRKMLKNLVYNKGFSFKFVLMDSWYATNK